MTRPLADLRALTGASRDLIEDFCRRWKVTSLGLSGSRQPHEHGVVGLFVRFDPEAEWNLTDRLEMQREFQKLAGDGVQFLSSPRSQSGRTMSVLYDA